jgi:hypothetical protein
MWKYLKKSCSNILTSNVWCRLSVWPNSYSLFGLTTGRLPYLLCCHSGTVQSDCYIRFQSDSRQVTFLEPSLDSLAFALE